jgi:DNA-binding NarL/FixJ family response regulator
MCREDKFGLERLELRVVYGVASGCTDIRICWLAFPPINQAAVRHFMASAFEKTGVSNRLDLALFAINHGLAPKQLTGLVESSRKRLKLGPF